MKKFLFFLSVAFVLGFNTNANTIEIKDGNNCEQFLADYEVWVNEVIEIYEKVKNNPMDVENTQKLMEATEKMSEWSEKWEGLVDCSDNEEYVKKMEKLEKKVEEVMGE